VGDLQAMEALLPAARVLGRGVGKVPIEQGGCLCEDFEATEFIRAQFPEEAGGVIQREGTSNAFHYGG
jgi:hypothetical protein